MADYEIVPDLPSVHKRPAPVRAPARESPASYEAPPKAPEGGLMHTLSENKVLIIIFAAVVILLIIVIVWMVTSSKRTKQEAQAQKSPPEAPNPSAHAQQSPPVSAHPSAHVATGNPDRPAKHVTIVEPPQPPKEKPSGSEAAVNYQDVIRTADDEELSKYMNIPIDKPSSEAPEESTKRTSSVPVQLDSSEPESDDPVPNPPEEADQTEDVSDLQPERLDIQDAENSESVTEVPEPAPVRPSKSKSSKNRKQ